jgi:hypothetical protein
MYSTTCFLSLFLTSDPQELGGTRPIYTPPVITERAPSRRAPIASSSVTPTVDTTPDLDPDYYDSDLQDYEDAREERELFYHLKSYVSMSVSSVLYIYANQRMQDDPEIDYEDFDDDPLDEIDYTTGNPPNPTPFAYSVPFDGDTEDTPLLKEVGMLYNNVHNILICWTCKSAINPDIAPAHARGHGLKNNKVALLDHINSKYPDAIFPPTLPSDSIRAIYGLCEPKKDYKFAECCNRAYKNYESVRRHACTGENKLKSMDYPNCLAQRFGANKPYFAVELPPPPPTPSHDTDALSLFLASRPVVDRVDDKVKHPANYRELSVTLENEGWIDHVQGHPSEYLMALVRVPKDDESKTFRAMLPHIKEYMEGLQTLICTQKYQVRELIASK